LPGKSNLRSRAANLAGDRHLRAAGFL
jgi:hypothetical protein